MNIQIHHAQIYAKKVKKSVRLRCGTNNKKNSTKIIKIYNERRERGKRKKASGTKHLKKLHARNSFA